MFSYYGSKAKIAKYYPEPVYDTIIEPFAGAAWYSVRHRSKNVILNEKYDVLYKIWKWLIEEADPDFIRNHSDFYLNQDIRTCSLPDTYRKLVGFCINSGSSSPKNVVQKRACQSAACPSKASTVSSQLNRIASYLPDIRHWSVRLGDYTELPDIECTWFIDPPYQYGGKYYKHSIIDYKSLAEWCKSRKGQIIVCENTKADWMDFKPFKNLVGQRHKTVEAVWTNI